MDLREDLPAKVSSGRRRLAWWAFSLVAMLLAIGWPYAMAGFLPSRFATSSAAVVLLVAGVSGLADTAWGRIPNWATYTGLLMAVAINGYASFAADVSPTGQSVDRLGAVGLESCLLGALACFFFTLAAYSLAKGGAGDVKLATAVGGLLGVERGILAICYAFVFAGVAALCWTVWKVGPVALLRLFGRWVGRLLLPRLVAPLSAEQQVLLQGKMYLGIYFAFAVPLAMVDFVSLPW